MSKFNIGWYLIYTRPHQETRVANDLQDMNIQVYLPMTKVIRKWSDRVKILDMPLFPCYLFVHLKSMHEFYNSTDTTKTDGGFDYVRFGKDVARLSDAAINAVRLIETGGENIELTAEHFSPGQQMEIVQGPLSGLTCEVVQHKGKDKILVRVHLLQRSILADMPANALHICAQA